MPFITSSVHVTRVYTFFVGDRRAGDRTGDRTVTGPVTGPVTVPGPGRAGDRAGDRTGDRAGPLTGPVRSGHSNLTYSFVGNAGVKFGEGCRLSNLTHPFMRAMPWENLDKEVALPTSLNLVWAMQG